MSVSSINTFSPFTPTEAAPIPLTETENKTDQLKSSIPIHPAEIPLEKDRFTSPHTEFTLFKDLNPDTNELEEGIFLKSPYPTVPTMKWEGLEELYYEEKRGLERKEISRGAKATNFNRYIGYFPKDCAAEDNYRIKGSHVCTGVFDHEGKLISGSWKYKQEDLSFNLVGDFTYETTETEQKIVCRGIYTFRHNHFRGTFVVTRKLNEAYFYCTQESEKAEEDAAETRTIEGVIYKGVFQEDRLISGSITYPNGAIIKGLWSYQTTIRDAIDTYCHGINVRNGEQGCFLHSTLQSGPQTALEWGKRTYRQGPKDKVRELIIEGQFFHLKTDNNVPTFITVYKPEKTSYRWTLNGGYYMTSEDARQRKREVAL